MREYVISYGNGFMSGATTVMAKSKLHAILVYQRECGFRNAGIKSVETIEEVRREHPYFGMSEDEIAEIEAYNGE